VRRSITDPLAGGLRHCAGRERRGQAAGCFDSLVATLPKIESRPVRLTRDLALKRDPVAERHADTAVLRARSSRWPDSARTVDLTLDNQQFGSRRNGESKTLFGRRRSCTSRRAMGTLWLAADHARKTRVTNQLVHCVGGATLATCSHFDAHFSRVAVLHAAVYACQRTLSFTRSSCWSSAGSLPAPCLLRYSKVGNGSATIGANNVASSRRSYMRTGVLGWMGVTIKGAQPDHARSPNCRRGRRCGRR